MESGEVVHAPGNLKLEEKAILAWKEEGILSAKIAERLGRHRASIDRLLAKTKGLPKYQIPNRKKGSGRPKKVNNVLKLC
jgi:transposase